MPARVAVEERLGEHAEPGGRRRRLVGRDADRRHLPEDEGSRHVDPAPGGGGRSGARAPAAAGGVGRPGGGAGGAPGRRAPPGRRRRPQPAPGAAAGPGPAGGYGGSRLSSLTSFFSTGDSVRPTT